PFTIQATGYGDGDNVYVEQCNGVDPSSVSWSAIADCDSMTAAGPAIAAVDTGDVSFPANDPVLGFHPFKDASPQGEFNCLSPNEPSPDNGLLDYRDCMIRVTTNLTSATPDQAFLTITLPEPGRTSTTLPPTTVKPTT